MRRRALTLIGLLLLSAPYAYGGTTTVTVSATVLSKDVCRFRSTPRPLQFGALNPANTADATAASSVNFRCTGSSSSATFTVSQDFGLYKTGPGLNRMQNSASTSQYLPYTLTLTPQSGTVPRNVTRAIAIGGTVKASDYQNAYAGSYTDTVTLTISP